MKGFLFALVGDLLSINAIASAFLAGLELCINGLANKKDPIDDWGRRA